MSNPRFRSPLACLGIFVLLSAGCAQNPSAESAAAPANCEQVRAQIAQAEQQRAAALEKQETAWKKVVPFAVLGQRASAKAEIGAADQRLAQMRPEAVRMGCASGDRARAL